MATSTGALARRLETQRKKARLASDLAERRIVIAGSGAAVGWLEKRAMLPIEVLGVPTKLAIGILGTLLEANSSGSTRRLAGAAADTAFAVYAYQAAKTSNFIAGEDVEYVGGEELVGGEV